MNRMQFFFLLGLAGSPAFAQDTTEAVESGGSVLVALLIMIIVGAVVGWLASIIVKGDGSGFWGDVLIGIGGAIVAGFLFPLLGLNMGAGIVGAFIPALIGAVLLLLIIRLIRRGAG